MGSKRYGWLRLAGQAGALGVESSDVAIATIAKAIQASNAITQPAGRSNTVYRHAEDLTLIQTCRAQVVTVVQLKFRVLFDLKVAHQICVVENVLGDKEVMEVWASYRLLLEFGAVSRATTAFEEDRRQRLNAARVRRHNAATSAVLTQDHKCLKCGRLCASGFGLRSHMRSHPV
ncbi:hypothetical protein Bbelb_415560 [Branchiostoma belcheri]|nr:hypothetical protein Bbelb_415560 [Branchiostoma belcheri]